MLSNIDPAWEFITSRRLTVPSEALREGGMHLVYGNMAICYQTGSKSQPWGAGNNFLTRSSSDSRRSIRFIC